MSKIFQYCTSLNSLPDKSKWDTKDCYLMIDMMKGCISLASLPNIEKLVTPFTRTYSMLVNYFSLIEAPSDDLMPFGF